MPKKGKSKKQGGGGGGGGGSNQNSKPKPQPTPASAPVEQLPKPVEPEKVEAVPIPTENVVSVPINVEPAKVESPVVEPEKLETNTGGKSNNKKNKKKNNDPANQNRDDKEGQEKDKSPKPVVPQKVEEEPKSVEVEPSTTLPETETMKKKKNKNKNKNKASNQQEVVEKTPSPPVEVSKVDEKPEQVAEKAPGDTNTQKKKNRNKNKNKNKVNEEEVKPVVEDVPKPEPPKIDTEIHKQTELSVEETVKVLVEVPEKEKPQKKNDKKSKSRTTSQNQPEPKVEVKPDVKVEEKEAVPPSVLEVRAEPIVDAPKVEESVKLGESKSVVPPITQQNKKDSPHSNKKGKQRTTSHTKDDGPKKVEEPAVESSKPGPVIATPTPAEEKKPAIVEQVGTHVEQVPQLKKETSPQLNKKGKQRTTSQTKDDSPKKVEEVVIEPPKPETELATPTLSTPTKDKKPAEVEEAKMLEEQVPQQKKEASPHLNKKGKQRTTSHTKDDGPKKVEELVVEQPKPETELATPAPSTPKEEEKPAKLEDAKKLKEQAPQLKEASPHSNKKGKQRTISHSKDDGLKKVEELVVEPPKPETAIAPLEEKPAEVEEAKKIEEQVLQQKKEASSQSNKKGKQRTTSQSKDDGPKKVEELVVEPPKPEAVIEIPSPSPKEKEIKPRLEELVATPTPSQPEEEKKESPKVDEPKKHVELPQKEASPQSSKKGKQRTISHSKDEHQKTVEDNIAVLKVEPATSVIADEVQPPKPIAIVEPPPPIIELKPGVKTFSEIMKESLAQTPAPEFDINPNPTIEAAQSLLSEALSELIDAATTIEPPKAEEPALVDVKSQPPPTAIVAPQMSTSVAKDTQDMCVISQSMIEDIPKEMKSKNGVGSGFVPSAKEQQGTRSLEHQTHDLLDKLVTSILDETATSTLPDIDRQTQNITPTTEKRNKNEANLKKSDEIKTHELPEKTPQEKTEGVAFGNKLLEIFEAVMVASPEQRQALKLAREKHEKKEAIPTPSQTATIENTTGTKPKTQQPQPKKASNNTKQKKPEIPPKPENLGKKQAKPSPVKESPPKKPDVPPKPTNVPPPNQKKTSSPPKGKVATSTSPVPKNLNRVPTMPNGGVGGWNSEDFKDIPPQMMQQMIEILKQEANKPKTLIDPGPLSEQELLDEGLDDDDEEEEEYIEYKFIPRQVFLANNCQICQLGLPSSNVVSCKICQMINYCSEKHRDQDAKSHIDLCNAIKEIARKRGGHVYNNAKILSDDDFRTLRVHTMTVCQQTVQRPLQSFEREILLFPRICVNPICREWRQDKLTNCPSCQQVSYCSDQPDHLLESHKKWCKYYSTYHKVVMQQKKYGRIEPTLPNKIMQKEYPLPKSMGHIFNDLYKHFGELKDNVMYSMLTQIATVPLTALHAAQKCGQTIGESFTIHLIGSEIQFEADTLDKWEAFFLHLIPQLTELKIVFIGPELNSENLPLDILSRIRMCRACRQRCRAVKFDFQCGKLYHTYFKSPAFIKPDLICFYNPGLHRATGFRDIDTWPETIEAAAGLQCPIVVTSYTEFESPKDLERLQKESNRELKIIESPSPNPFTSYRPERNFISDEIAPMIFKNFYCFIVN